MANTVIDQFIKRPDSQKIAVLVIILAAIVAGFYFYIYKDQRTQIEVQKAELVKLQNQFNEQQKILADLPRFKQELKDLQSKFDDALKMLPNSREIPALITNITNLAQEAGLQIDLFQPKPEVPMDFYAKIPVEMNVEGKYHQVGVFFDKLSKLPRIVNIADITMQLKKKKSRTKDTSISLNSSFSAITFKFIEKTGIPEDAKKSKKRKSRKK